MQLNVTTTAGCRGECAYCPQEEFKNAMAVRPALLTANEYQQLIDATADTHLESVSFGGFSEPLDNPEIVDLIRITHDAHNVNAIHIFTNGEMLTPTLVETLASVPLALVDVSCHGFEASVYQRTRSFIDPDRVRSNLVFLVEHRSNIGQLSVSVSGPFGSAEELARLEAFCRERGLRFLRRELHNRAGLLSIGRAARKSGPFRCGKFGFGKPVLCPGGDLAICCQDFSLQMVIGNLHQQSLGEVLQTSELRHHVLAVADGNSMDPSLSCFDCEFCIPVDKGRANCGERRRSIRVP